MSGLAYCGRVEKIEPIKDADRIEAAEVVCGDGGRWRGVVGKGQFPEGSLCTVYLQDAIVQPSPELAFMEKSGWRVRMARFRGEPSECVIVAPTDGASIGDDLTTALGVVKYEKAIHASLAGDALSTFPSFIPKTDEPNFQTVPRMLEALRGRPWYATVKMDGSSCTAYRRGDHFGVCSRNLELKETEANAYWKVAIKYDLRNLLPDNTAIQFEVCGPGIQKNPAGLKELDGYAFNLYLIEEHRYGNMLNLDTLCDFVGMKKAPLESVGPAFDFSSEDLRKMAEGLYPNGKQREGIVIRPTEEMRVGQSRLSFKVINLLYRD